MSTNKTVYSCYPSDGRGTIADGTTLTTDLVGIRVAISGYVKNFDTSNDITIKLNNASNDSIVVAAGESFKFDKEYIDKIILSNASGSDIEYQVVVVGG